MENEKTRVFESSVGDKEGWAFAVGKNFTSALYKTKVEAEEKLSEYLNTGKFDFYGTAEYAGGGIIKTISDFLNKKINF